MLRELGVTGIVDRIVNIEPSLKRAGLWFEKSTEDDSYIMKVYGKPELLFRIDDERGKKGLLLLSSNLPLTQKEWLRSIRFIEGGFELFFGTHPKRTNGKDEVVFTYHASGRKVTFTEGYGLPR